MVVCMLAWEIVEEHAEGEDGIESLSYPIYLSSAGIILRRKVERGYTVYCSTQVLPSLSSQSTLTRKRDRNVKKLYSEAPA